MTAEELTIQLKAGEGTRIEFKEARGGVTSSLYESVVSFSNTDGGTIVLGADDTGQVIGVDGTLIQNYQASIVTSLSSPESINPTLLLSPLVVDHPNGKVIVLQVPASS